MDAAEVLRSCDQEIAALKRQVEMLRHENASLKQQLEKYSTYSDHSHNSDDEERWDKGGGWWMNGSLSTPKKRKTKKKKKATNKRRKKT